VTIRRDGDDASTTITASLPALVSVTDQTGEARYPSFKGIMGAKKKPITVMALGELTLDLPAGSSRVLSTVERPARAAGTVVTDDGTAADQLADFLVANRLI
jgi:electron transfer flavoprotein beta subunit